MKKYLIFGIIGVVLVAIAGASYWFLLREKEKPPRYTRDPNAFVIPPVTYSMKGKTFVVPDQPETKVTLSLVAPSTKRDYPMGRFALATGTGEGQLYALDDFTTEAVNGSRVVPIVVSMPGTGEFVYIAVVDEAGEQFNHRASYLIGDRVRIGSLTRDGDQVTVVYNVHDRNQAMAELPSVTTTAIIDIATGVFVQEGRKPWLEIVEEAKEFTGKYLWRSTTNSDGEEVKPSVANVFSLLFDGPRITLGTDCNTGSSEFTPPTGSSTALSFGPVASTKMFCQSAEEGPYFEMVSRVTSFTEEGDVLTFGLNDGSEMVFIREGATLEFADDTAQSAAE
jgi:heat shock protein HslJ